MSEITSLLVLAVSLMAKPYRALTLPGHGDLSIVVEKNMEFWRAALGLGWRSTWGMLRREEGGCSALGDVFYSFARDGVAAPASPLCPVPVTVTPRVPKSGVSSARGAN